MLSFVKKWRKPGSVCAAIVLLTAQGVSPLSAGHIQRARLRCSIPKYNYGYNTPRNSATATAVAEQVVGDNWRSVKSDADLERRIVEFYQPIPTEVRRVSKKPFHLRAAAITVDHLQLTNVGISIFSTGDIVASGELTHEEGPTGGRLGNNVIVHLRAFAAHPGNRQAPDADSPVVWSSQRRLWMPAHRSEYISLLPDKSPQEDLLRFFNDITHIQVELEYLQDR